MEKPPSWTAFFIWTRFRARISGLFCYRAERQIRLPDVEESLKGPGIATRTHPASVPGSQWKWNDHLGGGGAGSGDRLAKFREAFNSAIISRSPAEVLLLFAIPPHSEWVELQVRELIAKAKSQFPDCAFVLVCIRDFGGTSHVQQQIDGFGLLAPEPITASLVNQRLGAQRVICISADGCTSVIDALLRAGFPKESIDQYFDEEIINTGRNSTLMAHLETYSKSHHHMLYSWQNLRTSSGGLVKAFKRKGTFFEASSASKVAEMFRRFILTAA